MFLHKYTKSVLIIKSQGNPKNSKFFTTEKLPIYTVKKTECLEVIVPTHASQATNAPNYPILLTAEHAGKNLPSEFEDWIEEDKWLVGTHWSTDMGVEDFTKELTAAINARAALMTRISRLIIDPNRPLDSDTLIRKVADSKFIKMNRDLTEEQKRTRIQRFYTPYHSELRYLANIIRPSLVLSLHSFTPEYEGSKRDVEVGVLYNVHEAPATALGKFLEQRGHVTRMNEPWSGKEGFMYAASTVQAKSRKAIMLEFRQDLLVKPEWRQKMVSDLVLFFGQNAKFFA